MATYKENLETARDEWAERLADLVANPKPTYSLDGKSVSWVEYQQFLLNGLEGINKAIQQAGAPFCVRSRKRPV